MVTFLKGYAQYNPGEVATFTDGVEADLIARGIAKAVPTKAQKPEITKEQKTAVTK